MAEIDFNIGGQTMEDIVTKPSNKALIQNIVKMHKMGAYNQYLYIGKKDLIAMGIDRDNAQFVKKVYKNKIVFELVE